VAASYSQQQKTFLNKPDIAIVLYACTKGSHAPPFPSPPSRERLGKGIYIIDTVQVTVDKGIVTALRLWTRRKGDSWFVIMDYFLYLIHILVCEILVYEEDPCDSVISINKPKIYKHKGCAIIRTTSFSPADTRFPHSVPCTLPRHVLIGIQP
jgi:hypothetical protein